MAPYNAASIACLLTNQLMLYLLPVLLTPRKFPARVRPTYAHSLHQSANCFQFFLNACISQRTNVLYGRMQVALRVSISHFFDTRPNYAYTSVAPFPSESLCQLLSRLSRSSYSEHKTQSCRRHERYHNSHFTAVQNQSFIASTGVINIYRARK
ncbi:hypothetical protein EDD18DRAFT_720236 [Armillaria luteobubalina]|uniref:Uncharacterized protein n=1 Tax=Armillaria luteobubalina TaxID=153913 RepID=A0AA39PIK0_9AGAR|nr:hypothetical protein EDD18DRAFT_720236 [Armillaria luteobubalina]